MYQDLLTDAVIPAMVTLLTAVLSILTGVAVNALRAWAAKQEAEWKRAVIEEATIAAENAVAAINQSLVDDLKAARADGKLTPEEGVTALKRAADLAVKQLGEDGMKSLRKVAGNNADAILMLYGLIEAAIKRGKDA